MLDVSKGHSHGCVSRRSQRGLGLGPEFSKDSSSETRKTTSPGHIITILLGQNNVLRNQSCPAVPRNQKNAKALQNMAAARKSSAVGTSSGRAKRARVEDTDPPDVLSGTPAAHTNNWSVRIYLYGFLLTSIHTHS
jgi:hypothetical protein